jgi:hypothetical protein
VAEGKVEGNFQYASLIDAHLKRLRSNGMGINAETLPELPDGVSGCYEGELKRISSCVGNG